ncbi:MAG: ABC transporter ATP-binding protein [Planctomycetota bacterium]|nr:ABC transporter ATP-binding protein [Planctomycetota bacterium]
MRDAITISGLTIRYGQLTAVDGIGFTVAKGETFGFLGPNGAGKTTCIHAMCGLLEPDEGEISLADGMNPAKPEARRSVGIAPQALSLYEELSGEYNLSFFSRMYGLSGEKLAKRVAESLDFVGLTERRGDRVRNYSGGMKRRLNLACALVHEPDLVFLDEPMVGVDPQSRSHMFDAIEKLRERKVTIVYTTHYMEEAQRLCDRVAIMDRGRIVALDTVDALIEKHGGSSSVSIRLDDPGSWKGEGEVRDGVVTIETEEPMNCLRTLFKYGVSVRTLKLERPNLERVFLNITGRKLRD